MKKAKKRKIKRKEKLIKELSIEEKRHLVKDWLTYLVVCTFLTALDFIDKSISWAYYVWLGWGFGEVIKTIKAFFGKRK